MSSSNGYTSPVNLPIGRVPLASDPDLFEEMTNVYNSIHILNQYLDRLRIIAGGGGGDGTTPAETVPFNRFFNAVALEPITTGMCVCPATGEDGIIPGILISSSTTAPVCNFSAVALNDAAIGELVRVGVGPAVIAVPGIIAGQQVWGISGLATNGAHFKNGTLYTVNPGTQTSGGATAYSAPVGVGIANGFALFGQLLWR